MKRSKSLFALVACMLIQLSFAPAPLVPVAEDAALNKHLQQFIREANARNFELPALDSAITIVWAKQEGPGFWDKKTRTITVSTKFRFEGKTLELIVFHELGHAWLNLRHVHGKMHLMNEALSPEVYRRNREGYVDNLFTGRPIFR